MNNIKKLALLSASAIILTSVATNAATNWAEPQDSSMWEKTWRYTDDTVKINRKNHVQNTFFKRQTVKAIAERKSAPTPIRSIRTQTTGDNFPANPKVGECYARVQIPPEYKNVTEEVIVAPASVSYEIVAAIYKEVTQKVLVKAATTELKIVPAVYKEVTEKVIAKEAYNELENIAAIYKNKTSQILVAPAYSTWQKGSGPIEKIDNISGDILCLVEVPAEYQTITSQVLVSAATTKTIKHAAEYQTITRQVLVTPAKTIEVQAEPAIYKTINVTKLEKAAYRKAIRTAATYDTITRRVPVSNGSLEWRTILCETNATTELFEAIQTQLKAKNYYNGEVTGTLTNATMDAVEKFQADNNLPTGSLTIATLKALGITSF